MKKLPLLLVLLAVSCAPALVGVCIGVGAAGVTAAVVIENQPKDAGGP